ncbi:DUF397 domain-containing protein [Streptosporangium sp. NPDC003464]
MASGGGGPAGLAESVPGRCRKAGLGSLHVLRDSKNPEGPKLFFTRSEWDASVGGMKLGEFDN